MSTAAKPISDTISFTLARVGGAHRSLASKMLAEVGLHVGQEMLLQILWQEDKLTQSELADHLCIHVQTSAFPWRIMPLDKNRSKVRSTS